MPPRFVYDLPVSDIILLYSKSRNCFYVDPTESINIPTVIRYPGLTKHPNLCRLIYESIFFSKSIERCKYCAYIHTYIQLSLYSSTSNHYLLTIFPSLVYGVTLNFFFHFYSCTYTLRSNERNLTRDSRRRAIFFFPNNAKFHWDIDTNNGSINRRFREDSNWRDNDRYGACAVWADPLSHGIRRISAGEEAGPDIKKKVLRAGCLAQLRPPRPANCLLPGLITSLCYSVNARRKPLCLPRLNSLSHVPTHTI